MKRGPRDRCRVFGAGFTLVEVIIAVGLTAATVLTVFALLVPGRDASREAALAAAAVRLQPALELDLRERGMGDVFVRVADGKRAFFGLYQVRVLPETLAAKPASGDLQHSAKGNLGDGFALTTMVRDLSDPGEVAEIERDLGALEGVIFLVRLGAEIGGEVQPVAPAGSFADFHAGALVVNAEFIEMPSGLPASRWEERAARRRPVLTVPLAVRR